MLYAAHHPLSEESADLPPARSRYSLALLAGLALAQLVAFWMLCSHQVRKAEVRRAEVQVQQMALSDCLEYIPGSTIASCSRQVTATLAGTPAPARGNGSALAGAMPVSFTFR